ncbi:SARP family transcriptional regulator [Planotetraspora thailandica]|uniref:SARP family transcriptional regulator n=1 Tax=Planotetraspora thailandica TaxID=487172 RepID=A0A8J3VEC3_9ACTN|nr:BTAD domain-containing putative transcriptional regulator [Planotetraspora thailandica]GII56535.1 SARP family transcriptional regulator [Planotetraspora thailandica]
MRFGILGTTRAWRDDGSEVLLGGPARRALLALLSVRVGEVVPSERLIDDLYGGQAGDGAGHALQSQVSRLRRALGPGAAIEFVPGGYRLVVDPEDVDVCRFERLSGEGRQALARGDPARAAVLLREALALWRGTALADVLDVVSVRAEVARLEEGRLGALEDRIEADLQRGGHRAVVPELRELVALNPLRERLRGLLMRALRADGRQAEALAVFEEIRRLLADELGADSGPELAAIHRSLLRGEPVALALPAQLTTFVGRAEDLAAVAELLARTRLVTLLGAGGVGKTRLAIEAASLSAEPEVCLVELARVRDAAEVPAAVLGALGLRDSGFHAGQAGVTPESRLVAALDQRAVLLLLDNCEHLVDAVAALAERLLRRCPTLRVLATSREPLGITGESLWPVRPLAPTWAARLFADRAAAVRPGFVVDDAEAATVRRICDGLDGLPLAIELAAARLRTHDVEELAAGLDDRFRLLSRGSRTAEARHQTMRAVVAWSWDLLSETERVMARRLTVFAGGATAEAVARVCAVPGAEDVLDSLVGKSLIEVADGRYRMLETVRAYCAERLEEAGEAGAVRRAHADHYLRLARTADPQLRGPEQLRWLATLTAEDGNLHAALRWSAESGETGLGLGLLASMAWYVWLRGTRASVTPWAAALLEAVGTTPPEGRETDYVLCALIAAAGGDQRVWKRCRSAAESIVGGQDRPLGHPAIPFLWPLIIAADMGDPEVLMSVITRGRTASDPWQAAVSHVVWGHPQLMMGEFAAAEQAFGAAAETFRTLGDRWGTALALDSLAVLAHLCDDLDTAIVLTGEALAHTERLGAMEDMADLLCNRGDYRVHQARTRSSGALAAAGEDYERAAEIARRAGSPTYLAAAMSGLGDIARLGGDLAGARRLYEQALERFQTHWLKSGWSRLNTLMGLGKVAEASGAPGEARVWYVRAVEAALAGPLPEGARAVEALAGIALAEDDATSGARLLGAATVLRGVAAGPDPDTARIATAVRAVLGDVPYEAAYQAGAQLPLADALRLAGVPEPALHVLARGPSRKSVSRR